MILLKSKDEIEHMRRANVMVAEILAEVRARVRPGVSTAELDALAEELTLKRGARPAFKGYTVAGRAFPASICISINDEVVHGVPSRKRTLREGDIVGLDFGVCSQGYYGDAAMTVPVGRVTPEAERLMEVTRGALAAGIDAIRAAARGPAGAELPHRRARRAPAGGPRARHRADGVRRAPRGLRQGGRLDGGDARRAAVGALRALRCGDRQRALYFEFTLKEPRDMQGDAIAVSGTVSRLMPNMLVRVMLDNGHQVLAHVSGALRMRYLRIAPGDKVTVEISPLDLSRGRITARTR